MDLSSAYRQIGVAHSQQWSSVVMVWSPVEKAPMWFLQHALPFGASASVLMFNRASAASREAGTILLHLMWRSFFDDFPHVEFQCLGENSKTTSECLLKILGWSYAVSEKKSKPFASVWNALGVTFQMPLPGADHFVIANKEGRVESIIDFLNGAIQRKRLLRREAEVLRGRVQYAESNMFGRSARIILAILLSATESVDGVLGVAALKQLVALCKTLLAAGPRRVALRIDGENILLYTDGALEDGVATFGAIIFDGQEVRHFGGTVPTVVLSYWMGSGSKNPIALVELLPVLVARVIWKDRLAGRKLLLFCDNNPVLSQLISGSSKNEFARLMLLELSKLEMEAKSLCWYARVPSPEIQQMTRPGWTFSLLHKCLVVCSKMPIFSSWLALLRWSRCPLELGCLRVDSRVL